MLDAICLIGPILRCREQLAAFRVAGVDLPILSPRSASRERARSFGHCGFSEVGLLYADGHRLYADGHRVISADVKEERFQPLEPQFSSNHALIR
jgi:hypothetical protein